MSYTQFVRPYQEVQDDQLFAYRKMKQKIKPTLKIEKFFHCLEQNYLNSNQAIKAEEKEGEVTTNVKLEHAEHRSFCPSFSTLSKSEKKEYLSEMMEELQRRKQQEVSQILQQQKISEYKCSLRVKSYCVPHWTDVLLKLNKRRKKLTIVKQGRIIDLQLRQFLLRKSKVHSLCFVLENVGFSAEEKLNNFHFQFKEAAASQFNQLEKEIKEIVILTQGEYIYSQISEEQRLKVATNSKNKKVFVFLTKQNVKKLSDFLKNGGVCGVDYYSTQLSDKQSQTNSLSLKSSDVELFRVVKNDDRIKIEISQVDPLVYRAKLIVKTPECLHLDSFIDVYRSNHKMIFRIKILEEIKESLPGNYVPSTMAVYQKLIWREKVYSQMMLARQEVYSDQKLAPSTEGPTLILSMKNVDHPDNRNFLQSIQIAVQIIDESSWEVSVFVRFFESNCFDDEAFSWYLEKFRGIFEGLSQIGYHEGCDELHDELLTVIYPEAQDKEEHLIIQSRQNKLKSDEKRKGSLRESRRQQRAEENKKKTPTSYMKHRYELRPSQLKNGVIMKEHFLWNNWKRAEKGGLVCKDEQLVERQKKLYKVVLKKFGQTLLTGKNIINFSLPVVVFKKESHLESLAKSYLYSPLYVEKAAKIADPLERMKYSILIMMTECALSIHMEKPFNPILGETFQGWIDGCPMYLEQISHHPPISAYYFIGRGFKKYGCIQPRISIGLNTGSGYSIFPHYVEFEDGMKIQYICAKIMIGGLLIGERTFNFEDKIYAYDKKHRYFASLSFGPLQKGFFSSSSEPDDYFHGYIYEVTPEFQQYFQSKNPRPHPQQKHIVKKLTFFDGIWNSHVNVNKQEVINFKTDLPYQFVDQIYPLPSDSKYREDLSNLRLGDLQAAQAAKEDMEELQRHDRKLRQQHQS